MNKQKLVLSGIIAAALSLMSPYCIGYLYVNITKRGNVFGFDAGNPSNGSVANAIIFFVIWIVALSYTYTPFFRLLKPYGKPYLLIPVAAFVIFFFMGLLIISRGVIPA